MMGQADNARRRILVSGATGNQGGAVASALLDRGFSIRALSRDPEKPAAQALANRGAEVMRGDLDDRDSLRKALEGVDGVFSVQNFFEAGYNGEVRQGLLLADMAREAGVRQLVYSSVASADRNTGIPHFESKWEIEQHVRSLPMSVTILRPVFLMQNWEFLRQQIREGVLAQPLDPDRSLQQIAAVDIGRLAAMAFESPERWAGCVVEVAGEELTMREVVQTMSRVVEREVQYYQVPWEGFHAAAGDELTAMYRWLDTTGYDADIDTLRQAYPPMMTLEGYLRERGWGIDSTSG